MERARARAASVSRSRGPAVVTSEAMRLAAAAAISSTARSNATWLILEGELNPLSFRTNCSEALRISSSVAGGSKLKSVLIFLHTSSAQDNGEGSLHQGAGDDEAHGLAEALSAVFLHFGNGDRRLAVAQLREQVAGNAYRLV